MSCFFLTHGVLVISVNQKLGVAPCHFLRTEQLSASISMIELALRRESHALWCCLLFLLFLHTSAVTYSTLLSRQPPRTSPKCVSAACSQTTRLSISLSVLRRSGSMNNGLHEGSGVSCHVKPSRQTWPQPSCALTWTCCVISRSTTSSSCTVTCSPDYSTSTAHSSRSATDARRPRRGLMLTAVMLDDTQELLNDVFDVDDVMRTDANGH